MLAAVVALTLMFAVVKHLVQELPVFVVAIGRTAFALLLMVPWMMRVGLDGLHRGGLGLGRLRELLAGVADGIDVMMESFCLP